MSSLLTIFLGLTLAAVLGVLLLGVYNMGRGGKFNGKYGNLLMRWRIALQLLAVGIMVMLFYINRN
ncbi:MAG: twin transmembrane helix small protein [Proteobacteria bacterium]|nr:twin transmembrane helix small protein [Pseudomonadota bacterium]